MKAKIITVIIVLLLSAAAFSQQLPLGTCGIVNIYDNAGNRTKRVYFCNNGIDPYPSSIQKQSTTKDGMEVQSNETTEIQMTDALYPNPTTGKFFVTFSKELKNAKVILADINGKIIQQFTGNGYKLDFDLSTVAAGVYFVRIEDYNRIITKKVVKQ